MKKFFLRLAFTHCRIEVAKSTFEKYYKEDFFRWLNETDVETMVYKDELSPNLKKRFLL